MIERQVENDSSIRETERLALICARNGQGLFRDRVSKIETRCRITGVENPVHLNASHCKLWRDSSNDERLNGENGLVLNGPCENALRIRSIERSSAVPPTRNANGSRLP